MYAIINASGSQHRIEPGMEFDLNRLQGEPGQTITLDQDVLMLKTDASTYVGDPVVKDAAVDLEIVGHFRGKKVIVFKMKHRKRYRRKQGHRQELTRVRVAGIRLPDGDTVKAAEAPPVESADTEDSPAEAAASEATE